MPRVFHHVRTDKIYLVGFMGAGKSTVSRALGSHLGWRVEDLDELVEAHEHRSIADLFAREGEAYFRVAEQGALRKLLDERHLIVATGGGTFVDPGNQSLINNDGASIWLDVSFEQVIDRLPPGGRRPLAADRTSMQRPVRGPTVRLCVRASPLGRQPRAGRRARRAYPRVAREPNAHADPERRPRQPRSPGCRARSRSASVLRSTTCSRRPGGLRRKPE